MAIKKAGKKIKKSNKKEEKPAINYKKFIIRLIGIIILIIILLNVDLKSIWNVLKNINLWFLGIAVLLILPTIGLRAYRWWYSLKCLGIKVKLKDAILMHFASSFVGLITPGRVGEFIKIYYIKSDTNASFNRSVLTVLLDRLYDVAILFIIAYISLFFFPTHLLNLIIILSIVMLIVVLVTSLLFLKKFPLLIKAVLKKISPDKINKNINYHVTSFKDSLKILKPKNYTYMLLITIISYFFYYLIYYYAAKSISLNIPLFYLMACLAITSIVTFLPISFFGLGTRDISLIFLFGLISISYESAIAYSFLILAIQIAGAVYGFIAWVIKPISI